MKRVLIIIVVLAQLAVLVSMAAQREWISRHGRHILLRTAPVDPSDYMRGDYARLNYEISNVPARLFRDGIRSWKEDAAAFRQRRDARVYAILDVDPDGFARLAALSDHEPTSGVYLRGRVDYFYANSTHVRYGVEALFMEEGTAMKFEQDERARGNDAPLDAEIALAANGTAVLVTTHREALGIKFKTERTVHIVNEHNNSVEQHSLIGGTVTLTNHGPAPLTVILRPNGRSFRLVPAQSAGDESYVWVNQDARPSPPAGSDFKVLGPGATITQQIDFQDPYWKVIRPAQREQKLPAKNIPLSELGGIWGHSYRLEYAPGIQFSDAAAHSPPIAARGVETVPFTTAGTD